MFIGMAESLIDRNGVNEVKQEWVPLDAISGGLVESVQNSRLVDELVSRQHSLKHQAICRSIRENVCCVGVVISLRQAWSGNYIAVAPWDVFLEANIQR